jgi:transposase-like protein
MLRRCSVGCAGKVKLETSTWHIDETFVRIAGRWIHLFRAIDSGGQTWTATACAVIAGIEAVQMIRKEQVLRITRKNLHGQAWVFRALLGIN